MGNLFGIGVLEQRGLAWARDSEWWGVFDGPESLRAAVFAGNRSEDESFGLAVAAGDSDAAELLGFTLATRGGVRWAVGEASATNALWQGLGSHKPRVSSNQVLMEASVDDGGESLEIRRARKADFEWVYAAASSMMDEDLGLDVAAERPDQFLATIQAGIASGQEFIGCRDGERVFRAKMSTDCSVGAQVGGIWVDPSRRGGGLGRAGTRALVRELLADRPRVTLHVRQENEVAIRCYASAGFIPVRAFRLLVR